MAAIPASPESRYAPLVWCAIFAISPTRPKNCRRKSRGQRSRRFPQSIETGGICRLILLRDGLDMTDLPAGEKEEGVAILDVITPHLSAAVLAGKGRRSQPGSQGVGGEAGKARRFGWFGDRRRNGSGRGPGRRRRF